MARSAQTGHAPPMPYEARLGLTSLLMMMIFCVFLACIWDVGARGIKVMRQQGYAQEINSVNSNNLTFVVKCATGNRCFGVLIDAWLEQTYTLKTGLYGLGIGGIVLLLVRLRPKRIRGQIKDPGGARYATPKELADAGFLAEPGSPNNHGYLGVEPQTNKPFMFRTDMSDEHAAIYGGSGSNKSAGVVIPSLLMNALQGHPAIGWDTKFPQYDRGLATVIPFFKAMGRPVYCIYPFHEQSHRIDFIPANISLEEAEQYAYMLYPHQDSTHAQYWKDNERDFMKAFLVALSRKQSRSLQDLYLMVCKGAADLQRLILKTGDESLKTRAAAFLDSDPNRQTGFLTGLKATLAQFDHKETDKAFTKSDVDGEMVDMREIIENGGYLHIGIPHHLVVSGPGRVRLEALKRKIQFEINRVKEIHKGTLPRQLHIYYEEAPNVGKIEALDNDMAMLRDSGITIMFTSQSRAAMQALYTPVVLSSIEANCGAKIFFTRKLNEEDLRYVSDKCGEMTVLNQRYGRSRKGFELGVKSESETVNTAPLLTVNELERFEPGEGIIFISGMRAARIKCPRYFKAKELGVKNPLYPFVKDNLTTYHDPFESVMDDLRIARKEASIEEEKLNLERTRQEVTAQIEALRAERLRERAADQARADSETEEQQTVDNTEIKFTAEPDELNTNTAEGTPDSPQSEVQRREEGNPVKTLDSKKAASLSRKLQPEPELETEPHVAVIEPATTSSDVDGISPEQRLNWGGLLAKIVTPVLEREVSSRIERDAQGRLTVMMNWAEANKSTVKLLTSKVNHAESRGLLVLQAPYYLSTPKASRIFLDETQSALLELFLKHRTSETGAAIPKKRSGTQIRKGSAKSRSKEGRPSTAPDTVLTLHGYQVHTETVQDLLASLNPEPWTSGSPPEMWREEDTVVVTSNYLVSLFKGEVSEHPLMRPTKLFTGGKALDAGRLAVAHLEKPEYEVLKRRLANMPELVPGTSNGPTEVGEAEFVFNKAGYYLRTNLFEKHVGKPSGTSKETFNGVSFVRLQAPGASSSA